MFDVDVFPTISHESCFYTLRPPRGSFTFPSMTNYFNSAATRVRLKIRACPNKAYNAIRLFSFYFTISLGKKFYPPSSPYFRLFSAFSHSFRSFSPSRSFDYPKLETIDRGMFEAFFKTRRP